jgi:photosystem II stability/assembly factor-like uncharacterized protein
MVERMVMKKHHCSTWTAAVAMSLTLVTGHVHAQDSGAPERAEKLRPAQVVAHAAQAGQLSAAVAGKRVVSVGDHGVVLTSDDDGKSWQQADVVPFDGLLTSVSFVDSQRGWAVGHAGVILNTEDGGRKWTLQRSDVSSDRPLFAVHFFDAQNGVAVGLWSLVLVTSDGGKTWRERTLEAPKGARKADLNLLGLFPNSYGELFAVAERGTVLRSKDRGNTWTYHHTGYAGSLWCGVTLHDGALLVGGLRGSLFRSDDDGATWKRLDSGTNASINSLALIDDKEVLGVGADGLLLRSTDGGRTFQAKIREDRRPLTAVLPLTDKKALLLSRAGPVAD